MKAYRVDSFDISEVEVEKITETSVWLRGRHFKRFVELESYHATFDEAKNYMIRKLQEKINKSIFQTKQLETKLQEIINKTI